ncbi:MAG: hypothetical protein IJO74_00430 [Clostridia bacterium]|nr:hypothetical protein [Clostridia bacterium]
MIKNDKLDALIMLSGDVLVTKNTEQFKEVNTSEVQCPKSLDRKVRKTINRENRKKQ